MKIGALSGVLVVLMGAVLVILAADNMGDQTNVIVLSAATGVLCNIPLMLLVTTLLRRLHRVEMDELRMQMSESIARAKAPNVMMMPQMPTYQVPAPPPAQGGLFGSGGQFVTMQSSVQPPPEW